MDPGSRIKNIRRGEPQCSRRIIRRAYESLISGNWIHRTLFLLPLAVFHFAFLHFPRPGWVDAGIYTGYILNSHLYANYEIAANAYQGTRLGFLLPAKYLSTFLGPIEGRDALVYLLFAIQQVSLYFITRTFIQEKTRRAITFAILGLSPLAIGSLIFGGADGAAAPFELAAIAAAVGATRAGNKIAAGICGLFAALAISSHLFAALSIFWLAAYLLARKLHKFHWKSAGLAFVGAITVIDIYGRHLGLNQFFLFYSTAWAGKSLHGVGTDFKDPASLAIFAWARWLPFVLAGTASAFMARNGSSSKPDLSRWDAFAPLSLLGIPGILFSFDHVIGGSMTTSLPYFNISAAPMTLGLIVWIGRMDASEGLGTAWPRVSSCVLAISGALIVGLQFADPATRIALKTSGVDARACYRSQIAFLASLRAHGLEDGHPYFIYFAANQLSASVYSDHYMGKPRYFDYIDSLASLFLWDQSIAARIPRGSPKKTNVCDPASRGMNSNLIAIGRNRPELNDVILQIDAPPSRAIVRTAICYDTQEYPWCWVQTPKCRT